MRVFRYLGPDGVKARGCDVLPPLPLFELFERSAVGWGEIINKIIWEDLVKRSQSELQRPQGLEVLFPNHILTTSPRTCLSTKAESG